MMIMRKSRKNDRGRVIVMMRMMKNRRQSWNDGCRKRVMMMNRVLVEGAGVSSDRQRWWIRDYAGPAICRHKGQTQEDLKSKENRKERWIWFFENWVFEFRKFLEFFSQFSCFVGIRWPWQFYFSKFFTFSSIVLLFALNNSFLQNFQTILLFQWFFFFQNLAFFQRLQSDYDTFFKKFSNIHFNLIVICTLFPLQIKKKNFFQNCLILLHWIFFSSNFSITHKSFVHFFFLWKYSSINCSEKSVTTNRLPL